MNNAQSNVSDSDSSSDGESDLSFDEHDDISMMNNATSSQERRHLRYGVGDGSSSAHPLRRIVWPPVNSSQSHLRSGYVDITNAQWGNPTLGSKMQLFAKTGFYLGVYPDGRVRGTKDDSDPHTFLEIVTGGLLPEHIKIKGLLTNMFVAMNKKGRLYAEPDPSASSTVFIESFQGSYNAYLSRLYAHLGWSRFQ
ncbi:hypothetical protein GWI33_020144 [Rhynchophorus ferrugineus]|uniref:FGF n=1 Tax=Rhynchophorus ferrugineus TaxID=354439 RepID=A0A834LZV2_RHYFE|nr:hypothetical protein GWI33_020144 [Rhynchophorus ferrugineus]